MDAEHDPFALDPDEVRDLGFGEAVARNERKRLLNQDGTFNSGGTVSLCSVRFRSMST